MKKVDTSLSGVVIIEPACFGDHRGWFSETYNKEKFETLGINAIFVQDNHSFSAVKGTLRGLHAQGGDFAQAKLVRVTRGSILDVAVDFRKDSPTYLQSVSVELSAENKRQLFIPRGFLHGFVTLSDDVEVQYKVDNVYNKESEITILYDDPRINIDWNVGKPILSEKDQAGLSVDQYEAL